MYEAQGCHFKFDLIFANDVTNQILVINSIMYLLWYTLFGKDYFCNVFALLSSISVCSTVH